MGAPSPKKARLSTPKQVHQPSPTDVRCGHCDIHLKPELLIAHQRSNQHKTNAASVSSYDGVYHLSSAFKNRINSFQIPVTYQTVNYGQFLENVRAKFVRIIEDSILLHKTIKINMEMFGNYFLKRTGEFSVKSFNTKYEVVTVGSNLQDLFTSMKEILLTKAQDFNENKSGKLIPPIIFNLRASFIVSL